MQINLNLFMTLLLSNWNLEYYSKSKKSWPILYSKLLYKIGQDFLDIYYMR